MRKILVVLFIVFSVCVSKTSALEIVYPKKTTSFVNTETSFFIGNAKKNEIIKINDEKVKIYPNGAFAHKVPLKNGKNFFEIKSEKARGKYVKSYYIIKEEPRKNTQVDAGLIESTENLYKIVMEEGVLRTTPLDTSLNRICELEKNSLLIINGEQGNFYRVKLTDSRNGWIKKDAVTKLDYEDEQFFGYFKESKTVDDGEKIIYKATFNRTLPYEVKTTETKIILNVYNVEGCSDLTSTVVFKKPDITTYSTQFVNGQLTLKINKHPNLIGTNSLRGVNIVIDAGHGGEENGTIGCLGTKEKDINFKQAKILKEILKNNGANVFLTREYDLTLSLKDRVKFAKENEAVIFVSLHFNAVPSGADPIKNKGTTVYYYNMASKNLAQAVQNNMVKTVFTKDNGIKRASFAVIRPTDYVGILVETAFLINPEDSLLYMQPKFLEETALAISQGIQDFITGTGDNYCTFKPISHKKKRCLKRK